ncbi:MAG: CaiB/BaiF CoA transferase family protein [Acidimicrobiales bacterium]
MLDGVRVVELGLWVAAPSAAGILADWGADVIKVEPADGDPMRRFFAEAAGMAIPEVPQFDLDNRGKRSVALDLRAEEGRASLQRLLGTADVFVTNLRVDALERLGLEPDAVRAAHPRLVYGLITGYGREGPDAAKPGYDLGAFWARSGMAAMMLPPDEPPPMLRGAVGDHVTGLSLVAGIAAVLFRRERTGVGDLVETSLLRAGIYCLSWDHSIQLRFGKLAPAWPREETPSPTVCCYRAGDGRWFWLLGVESDRLWPKLLVAIERPEWGDDERFASARGRRHHARDLVAQLDAAFAMRGRDEWATRFDAHDVWWAPVNPPADVVVDPQAVAAGAFVEVPGGGAGPAHRSVATPVSVAGDDARPRGPVPAVGEHTDVVLAELDARPDDRECSIG